MDSLITMWAVIYLLGLSAFYLLVLFIIPGGWKDMLQLFRDLKSAENNDKPDNPSEN